MVTLTANDFEQGGLTGAPGTPYEDMKFASNNYLRSKNPMPVYGKPVFIRAFVPGFNVIMYAFDENMVFIAGSNLISGEDQTKTLNIGGAVYAIFRLQKDPSATSITPSNATAAQIGVSVNRFNGNAGSSNLTATVAANTGEARTGNIVLKSKAGSTTYSVSVTQAGISGNISTSPSTFNVDYLTHPVTVDVTSVGVWSVSQRDTWITPSVSEGAPGETTVTLTIGDNTSNDARTGTITFCNDQTEEIAVVTVNQDGAPTSIGLLPVRVSGPKAGGNHIASVIAVSENNWTLVDAPSWVSVTPTSGGVGQTNIYVKYNTANPGAARTGLLRIENIVTSEIAICLITQEG